MEPELVVKMDAILGEGPIWDQNQQQLYWVDILGHKLFLYDSVSGTNKSLDMGQPIGTVVPRAKGGVLVALQDGIYHLDIDTGEKTCMVEVEDGFTANRFNDGKCDPKGRFWVGTMELTGIKDRGSLYCMETDHSITRKIFPVTVSNGLAWSLDHKSMYYIDTGRKHVLVFDYDIDTGDIQKPRVILEYNEAGHLDGMTIDEEGMLWIAICGDWSIIRVDPESGNIIQNHKLSVAQVTSCAFGGKELDELYFTSAQIGLNEKELARQPLAGSLVKMNVGVKGIPSYAYLG